MPGHELLFVGGLHRSGTTPLARVLATHPEVSGLSGTGVEEDEGQHLQGVYLNAREYRGPGLFAFHPGAHLTEASPLATAENAAALLGAWRRHWDLSRRVLVEKSPPNMLMSRFLQALFPGATVAVVVRHPLVVAQATRKWRPKAPLEELLRHWLVAHRILLEDAPHVRRLHVVQYERLVADPAVALAGLVRELRLPGLDTSALRRDRSERYRTEWESVLRAGRLSRRGLLRARLVSRFEAEVRRFGYSLEDLTVCEDFPVPR